MSWTSAPDLEVAPRERGAVLGQWNSAVTSYYLILGAATLLLTIGLVMVLSSSSIDALVSSDGASPYGIFLNQARYALVALPIAWVASRLPVAFYKRVAWPALLVTLGLQLLVFSPLGVEVNGNRNWILLPGLGQIQPSELVKLALAVWLGAVLARKRPLLGQWLHVLVPGVVVALGAIGLVLLGHDLGTAIVMLVLVAGALFVAGVPTRMFLVAGAVALPVIWQITQMSDSRIRRITAFFSDDCDPQKECYQTTRGLYALASGGWTGQGLGESREKWSYLPERHNDFIFAILGEELGLLGTVLVLALFGVLAVAMARVIRRHTDPFVQITTAAIAAWVLGQALINIAVVIGLLPVIGVPLPLVSAGGSALITTMIALGVVVSFARNEPGAAEALAARTGVVRRSLAVVGRSSRTGRGARG
ncbi:putative lipid II flippase FtsW [Actinotalea sp.]|uniref:putative lipid II flippase FtsW n=1 Tax=Actinotalea sp. TaxID=1872145 RepID=UPI002B692EAA|nr:putative lipid II flippase FtsW [Actinotalea sp.]HQY33432.1 putative lipid II flippase FtsW [Actinotalea sp.]HRA49766.1 putative lipid II flippase FtsW [Actinotalea sp.]